MKLGRASRKLFLVTLPSTLPVGLKRALMRSRKKYLKQQKYTPSMKMNSFLDFSEEQGCARDNISDVWVGYFEVRQPSSVSLVILFAVARRPFQKPAQWKKLYRYCFRLATATRDGTIWASRWLGTLWQPKSTGVRGRGVPADYASTRARAAELEAFGSVPWQGCARC